MQPSPALHGLGTHLKVALGQYVKRIWHLIGIGGVTLLACAMTGGAFWAASHFGVRLVPQHRLTVTAAAVCLGAVALAWLINWGATAAVIAVVNRRASLGACLSEASGKTLSTIWISLLLGFVMTGAAFLVVPWVLFSVWFYFAPFVLADGGSRGMDALLESREYVRGHWFSVFFRIVFIWVLYALLLLVPLAGPILALAFLPLVLFFNGVLYDNLKELRGGARFYPRSGTKLGILATSTAGFIMPPLLLLALMGPMLWQVLERHAPFGGPQPSVTTFKIAPFPAKVPGDGARTQASANLPAPRRPASPGSPSAGSGDAAAHPLTAVVFEMLHKLRAKAGQSALQAAPSDPLPSPPAPEPRNGIVGSRQASGGPQSPRPDSASPGGDILHWLRQGEFYLAYGNYRAAIENFERVVALDPENSTAHFNRAVAYGEIGDFAAAGEAIERALRVAPANGLYYYGRGRLRLLQGDPEGARADFRQAQALGYSEAAAYL